MRIEAVNESSFIIYLGDQINDRVAAQVRQASLRIRQEFTDLIIDLIPSYTSVLIHYDGRRIDHLAFQSRLKQALAGELNTTAPLTAGRLIELPVYYGPEAALDMAEISAHIGLSAEEIIELHSAQDYRVYAIGFAPGFAYLGLTDKRLTIPRKATPRLRVPSGSVGLADNQTAIYPSTSPGGWQIIGRTPTPLVDWDSEHLTPFEVGDRVRFHAISRAEFISLGGQLDES